jgi:hypothetical protein
VADAGATLNHGRMGIITAPSHAKRVLAGLEARNSVSGEFDEPDQTADAVGVTWGG